MLRHITLPLLMPFLVIITLLTIEATLQVFDLMQTMTGGGPFFSTEVIEIYIYRWAFAATIPQLGFASAAAVLFGLFVCVVGLLQLLGVRAARRARADTVTATTTGRVRRPRRRGRDATAGAAAWLLRRLPWWIVALLLLGVAPAVDLPVPLDGVGVAEGASWRSSPRASSLLPDTLDLGELHPGLDRRRASASTCSTR